MKHDDALPARLSDDDLDAATREVGLATLAATVPQNRALLRGYGRAVEQRVRAALAARAEPEVWYKYVDSRLTGIRTQSRTIADEWIARGEDVRPLYAAPPALPPGAHDPSRSSETDTAKATHGPSVERPPNKREDAAGSVAAGRGDALPPFTRGRAEVGGDRAAATRRAIVCAAAEIAKARS